jgi:hypothetical protein
MNRNRQKMQKLLHKFLVQNFIYRKKGFFVTDSPGANLTNISLT